MFVSVYYMFTNPSKGEDKKDFGTFMAEVSNPLDRAKIEKVIIQPKANNSARYVIQYHNQPKKTVTQGEFFGETTTKFRELAINYSVDLKEENTFWATLLIQWLPMMFLFVIF